MSITTNEKIRVRLESFDRQLLLDSCQKISSIVQKVDPKKITNIPLPTNKRIYCVIRSPHVDKDSREHFEIRIHRRVLEIYPDSDINIFDLLVESDLPPGVFYRICLS